MRLSRGEEAPRHRIEESERRTKTNLITQTFVTNEKFNRIKWKKK